jgi:hypothetical protein
MLKDTEVSSHPVIEGIKYLKIMVNGRIGRTHSGQVCPELIRMQCCLDDRTGSLQTLSSA